MVFAHVTDAWTREADRHDERYFATVFVNGLAAPMFLTLAGVALVLAAGRRSVVQGRDAAGRSVRRRGWQVFGLAFLFRSQSQLLGWGPWINFLKVDILNIMGLAMVGVAWIWRHCPARPVRLAIYAGSTVFFAMLNPVVREMAWLTPVPDPIEWYIRSMPGRTSFSLFPWAGFVTAGAIIGELVGAVRQPTPEWRLHLGLAAAVLVGLVASLLLSYMPSIYANSQFWSTSPVFFFIRLALVVGTVPLAWAMALSWEPLVTMGRSSLFVYWIHVEMVYGSAALFVRRLLPWEVSMLAAAALCMLLYKLVQVKNAWMAHRALPRRLEFLAPVLK